VIPNICQGKKRIIEVVNTVHNGKNMGTEPVKLAVFYLGAEGTPNVIKHKSLEKL